METKAEDTRLKGEEIHVTKIIAELEASIAKYKEYAMLISDANVIKNDLTTVKKKVRKEREGGEREGVGEREGGCKTLVKDSFYNVLYCPVHMCSYSISSIILTG